MNLSEEDLGYAYYLASKHIAQTQIIDLLYSLNSSLSIKFGQNSLQEIELYDDRFDRTKNNLFLEQNIVCKVLLQAIVYNLDFSQIKQKMNDITHFQQVQSEQGQSESIQNLFLNSQNAENVQKDSDKLFQGTQRRIHIQALKKIVPSQHHKYGYHKTESILLTTMSNLISQARWLLYLFDQSNNLGSKQFFDQFSGFDFDSLKQCLKQIPSSITIAVQKRLNRCLRNSNFRFDKDLSKLQKKLLKQIQEKNKKYNQNKIQKQIQKPNQKQFKNLNKKYINQPIKKQINKKETHQKIKKQKPIRKQIKKQKPIQKQIKKPIQQKIMKPFHNSINNLHATRSKKIQKFYILESLEKLKQKKSNSSEKSSNSQSDDQSQSSLSKQESKKFQIQNNYNDFSFQRQQENLPEEILFKKTNSENKANPIFNNYASCYVDNQKKFDQKNILLYLLFQTCEANEVALRIIMQESTEELKAYVKNNLPEIQKTGYLYSNFYKQNQDLINLIRFSTIQRSQYVKLLLVKYFKKLDSRLGQKQINLQEGQVKLEWMRDDITENQDQNQQGGCQLMQIE